MQLAHFERAFDDCTRAIKLAPAWTPAYNLRAFICERQLNYEGAIADHNAALLIQGQPVRAQSQGDLIGDKVMKGLEKMKTRLAPIYRNFTQFVGEALKRRKTALPSAKDLGEMFNAIDKKRRTYTKKKRGDKRQ